MRRISLTAAIAILMLSFAQASAGQSDYKGVWITRGSKNPDMCRYCDWTTNCVYVCNYNKYPVMLEYEYKLGSREARWRKSGRIRVEPTESARPSPYDGTDVPYGDRDYAQLECHDGEIKALRIVYVDILKPSVIERVITTAIGIE